VPAPGIQHKAVGCNNSSCLSVHARHRECARSLNDHMMGNMAAEWDALQEYLEHITTMDTHAYVPFSVQSAVLSGVSLGGQDACRMPFA